MIFRKELAEAVMRGEKTATRRRMNDNPNSPWYRRKCGYRVGQVFTINPGRGVRRIGEARVTRVYKQKLSKMRYAAVLREGFCTIADFRDGFAGINGAYDPDETVWVVEFERLEHEAQEGKHARA